MIENPYDTVMKINWILGYRWEIPRLMMFQASDDSKSI
jgi:hypothetical protein